LIRRALTRVALLAMGAVLSAAVVAALFLERPELLLTDRVVAAALRHFGAAYAPRWSKLSFSAAAIGRRRHRYALSSEGICAEDPRGVFMGCFKRLEFAVVVRYSRRGARLEVIENLDAVGERVVVDLGRRAPAATRAPPAPPFVRSLRVELPDLILRTPGLEASGSVSASVEPGRRRPAAFKADLRTRGKRAVGRVKLRLTADTDLFNAGEPSFLDAKGFAVIPGRGRARVAMKVLRAGARYELSGGAEVYASTGPLLSARLTGCRGTVSRGEPGEGSGELACRYEVVASKPIDARLGVIKTAAGAVRANGELRAGRLSAVVHGTLDPIGAWYELSGSAEGRLAGRLGDSVRALKLSHDVRALLKVPKFEDLAAFLRETSYAVPAPFHVLSGPLSLALELRGDPRSGRQEVRYVLETALAGARQKLVARTTGKVSIVNALGPRRGAEHSAEVLLKDVALELPKLEAGPAPKITLDRRITSGEETRTVASSTAAARAAARPLAVRSRVTVRTERPMILYSNLAKEPVPVGVDLTATHPPAAVAGRVSVSKFDVELFRRRATLDHMNVTLSSGSRVGRLEGLLLYNTPSASIRIAILGTTERPRVELTSVPPLKREDIIGLLIFGKNPNELDPEQTASVSNTETALESRAFGLASLYLFGATPIEHVGYDSATRTTSVKLRLPGGARLTLGSDFDQSRQLTVRKPLSPHWAIQSEISEQGQQSKAATTFLEWLNRY